MKIFPGERVAIVGPSGCGKSTIVGLLQRLWEPTEGGIFCSSSSATDDKSHVMVNLNEIQTHHLRSKLSLVSQSPQLFLTESIASNIRYGSNAELISDEAVVEAAKAANAHEVVVGGRLKGGYECVVVGGGANAKEGEGDGHGSLSGGEMQRLQIARAIARIRIPAPDGAELLILDECTSALDVENEGKVMDAIRGIVNGEENAAKTTLIITHKISVMQLCDRIIVLDQGSVNEEGTFDELMKRRGTFASLASGGEFLG